jgi:hypothetical protein
MREENFTHRNEEKEDRSSGVQEFRSTEQE